jgi:dihydrofolate reductase
MRKITAGLFTSIDGVVEAPEEWHFPYFNEEMGAAVGAQITGADTLLLGRKTYEGFADAWPEREEAGEDDAAMAKQFGDMRKVVVSHQDLDLTWRNSEQLGGDLVEAITALKEEPGGDIGMSGSISIVRQLLDAGLLDELHLLVHPIAVRHGMRLFDDAATTLPLKVLKAEAFSTGVQYLVYGPDDAPPTGGYEEAVKASQG